MSLQSKFLKIVQAGYENYTGPIGAYEFSDGVSTVMIPRVDRDRLATAFQFVEFTEAGVDEVDAGVAARMLRDGHEMAAEMAKLERQTDEEKAVEDATVALQAPDFVPTIYSREELEKIADKKGINGLRDIAEPWNVKHRSILPLIALIEQAQQNWIAEQQTAFEARGLSREAFEAALRPDAALVDETPSETPSDAPTADPVDDEEESFDDPVPEETPSPEISEEDLLKQAAASGDVSAAINQE